MKRFQSWSPALLFLIFAGRALGCSCGAATSAPACERISTAQIVFAGTVRAIEPDPNGAPGGRLRVYRFDVDGAYKGLPRNTAEVVVNPDNFTSCQTEFRLGVRYLVFASRLPGTDELLSGGCHGSRVADGAVEDMRFLEAYRRNEATNSVFGRVLQWVTEIGRPRREEDAPVYGAEVVLRNETRTLTVQSTATGDFRFERIPAGAYSLFARLSPYIPKPVSVPVEVPTVGCVERFPKLESRASISGVLTTDDGHGAPRERVELLRRNQKGAWYSTYDFWTRTDAQGRFEFNGLPDGDYLIGYAIQGGKPSLSSAYPSRYFPGVADEAHASIVHLSPLQAVRDLRLSLGKQHTPRPVRVEVVWPEGLRRTATFFSYSMARSW